MKIEGDELVFTSGNREYCHNGMISVGFDEDLDRLVLGYGQDGGFNAQREGNPHGLSDEDAVELADHMLLQWMKFKAQHEQPLRAGDPSLHQSKEPPGDDG